MTSEIGERPPLPDTLTISEAGVTVTVRPLGWLDMVEIPAAFDAILDLPTDDAAQQEAFRDALVAFAGRIDAYAVGEPAPSRIPPSGMRSFVLRWVAGVRDAAIPPAGASGSRSQASTPPAATPRRTSRRKS